MKTQSKITEFKFKIFTLLEALPERILTSTGAAPDKPMIDGADHVKITEDGVTISPEFWIGRFNRKNKNER